ncbi:MAG: TetR family transcriptional regulator [Nocardioidaceae bacterium]|nr:TetR family transcriptional regulator [Nocardioidaceae bacterium]
MARPSAPILSADKIARTALALVDTTGEFTVNGVAAKLGVRPSSLYNHVAGKVEIVEAMRGLVFADGALVLDPESSWDETLPQMLRAYRDAFAQHPRLIPMLTAYTVVAPRVMEMYGVLATVLVRAGVPDDRLLDAITVMDSYVIGSALDLAAPDLVWDPESATSDAMRSAIEAAPRGRARADQSFELGLEIVLRGVLALAD